MRGPGSMEGSRPPEKKPTAAAPRGVSHPVKARNRKAEAPRFRSRADQGTTATSATVPCSSSRGHGEVDRKFRKR